MDKIHIERPNMVSMLSYLILLNLFWGAAILGSYHFNINLSNPWIAVGGACIIWHTFCSMLGVEAYTDYPANIILHICGSVLSVITVASLVGL